MSCGDYEMAEFIKKVKCGDKTYNLSASGKDVYYSSSSKTGGTTLKGVKLYNNELRLNETNKEPTDLQLCNQIKVSNNSSGFCFISTAICDTLDKPDDCLELTQLRQFRDEVMLTHPNWQGMVAHYYQIAPAMAEELNQQPNKTQLCDTLYQDYLVPSLAAINQGDYARAIATYQAMVEHCQQTLSTPFVEE